MQTFETLHVSCEGGIAEVQLARPERGNALTVTSFREFAAAFEALDADPAVRVVVLHAAGKAFTYGLDLMAASNELGAFLQGGLAAERERLRSLIVTLQRQCGAAAACRHPVIAAVQGACIGGGLDLISACDLRVCTADARFSLRETRVAMVADLGSLQRLPFVIGDAATRELALTAKDIDAPRALALGLVSAVLPDAAALLEHARAEARTIAALPPLVVQGVKRVLNRPVGRAVADGLDHVAVWNSAFLPSEDLLEAMMAFMQKRPPAYTGR